MTWTKGEWTVCTESYVDNTIGLYVSAYFAAQGDQDSYLVDICHLDRLYLDSATFANARLIAKAPEMAELLQILGHPLYTPDGIVDPEKQLEDLGKQARQLLAEIEGEAKP